MRWLPIYVANATSHILNDQMLPKISLPHCCKHSHIINRNVKKNVVACYTIHSRVVLPKEMMGWLPYVDIMNINNYRLCLSHCYVGV